MSVMIDLLPIISYQFMKKETKTMKNLLMKTVAAAGLHVRIRGWTMAFAAVFVVAVAYLAKADYQYIVSGYPVNNPCSSLASDGLPLATGCYTYRSAESPLEARFRTFLESAGSKLLSTKFIGLQIVIH